MWLPPDGDNLNDEQFAAFYLDQLEDAYEEYGAFWVREYGWGDGKCDPCEGYPPDLSDLYTLGFPEDMLKSSGIDLYFSRLHVRYSPEEATQDVMMYSSGMQPKNQQRYIDYNYELESRFPVCGQGYPLEPGMCDFDEGYNQGDTGQKAVDGGKSAGCRSRSAAGGLLLGFGLIGWRRRRR